MPDKDAEFLPQGEDHERRELSTSEARQAVPLGRMRYVLGIGLFLVIGLFALIYFIGP
jgi:hypothetical protein